MFRWPSKVHKYQCTQNTHCFCIFLIFQFLFYFYNKKKKNKKKKINKKKNLKKKKKNIKTRLNKNKNKTYKKKKKNSRREKKVIESLGVLFLPNFGRPFPLIKPLNPWWGGRIETIQVRKEHESFEKISKGSKRGLKLILASRCYHVVTLLSG